MLKKIIILVICYFQNSSFAKETSYNLLNNIGFSLNILGPLYGEYSVGLSSFINEFVQIEISQNVYSTQYVSPEIQGWQTNFGINYYFSTFLQNSFFLGFNAGYESVEVRKKSNEKWNKYNDITWSIIPGYSYAASERFSINFGISYGYNLGDTQLSPQIGLVFLL
jgi:hypothetical protein